MDQDNMSQAGETKGGKRKGKGLLSIIIILVILLLVGVAAFAFLKTDIFSDSGLSSGGSSSNVVATVNGAQITRQQLEDRIERNREALVAQGTDLDDPATLSGIEEQFTDQLISETLVLADAERLGISVTAEQIDEQFEVIRGRFETEEEFEAELDRNRFTEQSLRENIRRELILQAYVDQVSTTQSIAVTEEEITAFYDQLTAQNQQQQAVPPLADLRDQIENQIRNQKLAQILDSTVSDLRTSADIVIEADTEEDEGSEGEDEEV